MPPAEEGGLREAGSDGEVQPPTPSRRVDAVVTSLRACIDGGTAPRACLTQTA